MAPAQAATGAPELTGVVGQIATPKISPNGDLLTASTGPTYATATFGYDANGRMTSCTDAAGTSTYTWTARDQLETITDPLTSTTRTHVFDPAGQLDLVNFSGGATRDLDYDDRGLLTSDELTDNTANVTAAYQYDYDADGYMTTRTANLPGNPATGVNSHTYDNAGRITSWTQPDGTTVTYGWDNAGNLTNNAGTTATFDERNQVLTSGTTTHTWTPRGTTATITAPPTGSVVVASDDFDLTNGSPPDPALWTLTTANNATADIQNNELDVALPKNKNAQATLTSAATAAADLDIAVDLRVASTANKDQARIDIAVRTPGDDIRVELLSNSNTATLTDGAGNSATFTIADLSASQRVRLRADGTTAQAKTWATGTPEPAAWAATITTTVTAPGTAEVTFSRLKGQNEVFADNWEQNGPNPPPVTTTYTFDGLGRATATAGGVFTYDGLDRVVTAGADGFSYAGFEIDPVTVGDLTIARSPNGVPIAAQDGALAPVLYGRNSHGDIGYHFNSTGAVSASRTYDPFGAVVGESGDLTALGFQGDYTDATSGEVWMGARWYQPGTSSFTSRDTVFGELQTPISLNRYTYAWANPTGMWDPDGRDPETFAEIDFSGNDCSTFKGDLAVACERYGGDTQPDVDDVIDNCSSDTSTMSSSQFGDWVESFAGSGGQSGCAGARSARLAGQVGAVTDATVGVGTGIAKSPYNIAKDVGSAALHPIESSKSLAYAATHPRETAKAMWAECSSSAEAAGGCWGEAIFGSKGTTRVTAALNRAAPSMSRSVNSVVARATEAAKTSESVQAAARAVERVRAAARQFEAAPYDPNTLNNGPGWPAIRKKDAPRTAPGGLRTVADEIGEVRSYPSYRKAQADLGTRPSSDIHHIVEQCQCSPARSGFPVSRVNSTDNLIRLPGDVHDRISAFYSSRPPGFPTTVRNTLNGMPFEQQYDFGLDVIRRAMGGPL